MCLPARQNYERAVQEVNRQTKDPEAHQRANENCLQTRMAELYRNEVITTHKGGTHNNLNILIARY
jgi:hypothetical protein